MIRRALFLAAIAACAAGCGPRFDHLELNVTTFPPLPVSVESAHVGIPAGIAVGVDATPIGDDGRPMDDDVPVGMSSSDESILGIAFQSGGGDDPDKANRSFVIFGVAPGSAVIHVEADGEPGRDIAAVVAEQQ